MPLTYGLDNTVELDFLLILRKSVDTAPLAMGREKDKEMKGEGEFN